MGAFGEVYDRCPECGAVTVMRTRDVRWDRCVAGHVYRPLEALTLSEALAKFAERRAEAWLDRLVGVESGGRRR